MNKCNNTANDGIGIGGLLGVVFIVLRLCGVINWSWWWVLSPFWIPIAIVVLSAALLAVVKASDNKKNKGE